MRWGWALVFLCVSTLIFVVAAQAREDIFTCRAEVPGLKPIVGSGHSKEEAFEDAATQCFEQFRKHHRKMRGVESDEETGVFYIDTCANLICLK